MKYEIKMDIDKRGGVVRCDLFIDGGHFHRKMASIEEVKYAIHPRAFLVGMWRIVAQEAVSHASDGWPDWMKPVLSPHSVPDGEAIHSIAEECCK